MITGKQLKEFKILYKKEFGGDISNQEALESATKLIDMMRLIYKPIRKSDYEKHNRRES